MVKWSLSLFSLLTLSKLRCFLSMARAAELERSSSSMRSSISVCSRTLVLSREEHLALDASTASSVVCRRTASFFLTGKRTVQGLHPNKFSPFSYLHTGNPNHYPVLASIQR